MDRPRDSELHLHGFLVAATVIGKVARPDCGSGPMGPAPADGK
jgi:hypothetical protein